MPFIRLQNTLSAGATKVIDLFAGKAANGQSTRPGLVCTRIDKQNPLSKTEPEIWQPRFQVWDQGEAYELRGELTDQLEKQNLSLRFLDDCTLVIEGQVETEWEMRDPDLNDVERIVTASEPIPIRDGVGAGGSRWTMGRRESPSIVNIDTCPRGNDPKAVILGVFHIKDRHMNSFSLRFNFPRPITVRSVSANYRDGELIVVLPKAQA